MDRARVQRCLEVVAAYRASGQKSKVWAAANGVPERVLASWCAHSRRWQARLGGVSEEASRHARSRGFLAGRVGVGRGTGPPSIRLEVSSGTCRLELHWPLAHTMELAALMRELSR